MANDLRKGVKAMAEDTEPGVGRRGFLGALATLSASAAALTAAGGPAEAQETPEEMIRTRYQETEHVLTYYRTNRY